MLYTYVEKEKCVSRGLKTHGLVAFRHQCQSASCRCCLALPAGQMTETRRRRLFAPQKQKLLVQWLCHWIGSHTIVWELGSGMVSPGAVKPRSLVNPYRMNLCCAIYSRVGWRVEMPSFRGWISSFLLHVLVRAVSWAPCMRLIWCWSWLLVQVRAELKLLFPKPCLMYIQLVSVDCRSVFLIQLLSF